MKKSLVFFVLSCLFFPQLTAQFTLLDSLVAWYPMSGDALDASGNQNHGMAVGAVLTTDRFGTPNEAYYFDGVDDYISLAANQKFKPDLPVTITAWVRPEVVSQEMVFKNDYQENEYHGVWFNLANGRLAAAFSDGGPVGPQSRRSKRGSTDLAINTWYHLAVIIRGANDMDLFVNGLNDCGTYSGSGGPLAYSQDDGRMGRSDGFASPGPLQHFQGKIDDLRFYNRELSQSEIISMLDSYAPVVIADTICLGDSKTLSVPSGYVNYNWSPGTGLSCSNCSGPVASPTQSTSYKVLLTKQPGCVDTITINLEVDTCCLPPEIQSIIVTNPDCSGASNGAIQLQASSIATPVSYSLDGGAFQSGSTFSGLPAGTYTITTRNAPDCERDTVITLAAPPPIVFSVTSVQHVNCPADSTGIAFFSATGGSPPYSYSIPGFPSTTSPQLSNLPAGSYTATLTDNQGCQSMVQFSISSNSQLATSLVSVTPPSCVGFTDGGFSYSTTGGPAPFIYSLNGAPLGAGQPATGLSAGTYLLVTTDATGCSHTLSVAVPEPDSLIPSISVLQEISCFGQADGSLIASGSGGQLPYLYSWINGPAGPSHTGLSSGAYTVTVTDDKGCVASESFFLSQPDSLITYITVTSDVLCHGESTGTALAVASGGTSPYQFVWNGSVNAPSISSLPAGLLTLVLTDQNGCQASASTVVWEPDPIILDLTVLRDNLCFGEEKGQAAAQVSGGTSPYIITWNQTIVGDMVSVLPAGMATVVVTDWNGCETTDSIFINQPDQINVIAELQEPLCHDSEDGQILVLGEGGMGPYIFSWISPVMGDGPLLSGLQSGGYSLQITDQNQCRRDTIIQLNAPAELVVDSIEVIPAFCGREGGSILVIPGGGTPDYQFLWGSGNRDSLIENLGSGSYSVLIEDENGCTLEQTITLEGSFPVDAIAAVDSSGILPFSEDHPIQFLNFSTGQGTFSWEFGDGQGSSRPRPQHVYGEPGDYLVILTMFDPDSACPDRDTVFISLIDAPRIYVPSGFTPNDDGVNDFFRISGIEVSSVSILIFSRWGKEVTILQAVDQVWDGKDLNGKDVPEGVYVYKLEAVTTNGQPWTQSGTITLIR